MQACNAGAAHTVSVGTLEGSIGKKIRAATATLYTQSCGAIESLPPAAPGAQNSTQYPTVRPKGTWQYPRQHSSSASHGSSCRPMASPLGRWAYTHCGRARKREGEGGGGEEGGHCTRGRQNGMNAWAQHLHASHAPAEMKQLRLAGAAAATHAEAAGRLAAPGGLARAAVRGSRGQLARGQAAAAQGEWAQVTGVAALQLHSGERRARAAAALLSPPQAALFALASRSIFFLPSPAEVGGLVVGQALHRRHRRARLRGREGRGQRSQRARRWQFAQRAAQPSCFLPGPHACGTASVRALLFFCPPGGSSRPPGSRSRRAARPRGTASHQPASARGGWAPGRRGRARGCAGGRGGCGGGKGQVRGPAACVRCSRRPAPACKRAGWRARRCIAPWGGRGRGGGRGTRRRRGGGGGRPAGTSHMGWACAEQACER